MKILFKNTTKYTQDAYLKYCIFYNEKNHRKNFIHTVFVICLFLYLIVMQTINHSHAIIIFCGFLLTCFILWKIFYPMFVRKKEISSEKISSEKEFIYVFYDTHFTVRDNTTYSKILYSDLTHIQANDEFSYLFIGKRRALILDNNCFSIGTFSDFKSFLKDKYKRKFKYYPSTNTDMKES